MTFKITKDIILSWSCVFPTFGEWAKSAQDCFGIYWNNLLVDCKGLRKMSTSISDAPNFLFAKSLQMAKQTV